MWLGLMRDNGCPRKSGGAFSHTAILASAARTELPFLVPARRHETKSSSDPVSFDEGLLQFAKPVSAATVSQAIYSQQASDK
jgi:hypothetical protein